MKSRLLLPWSFLVGLFYLTSNAEAARATTLILGKSKPEPKIDTLPTAEEENVPVPATINNLSNETINAGNVTKLTGVPQIDYIYDPNLPRELNGYNLTDYPFYNSVPEDIDFKCDGLHDGFYASVPHKCQVYHHCLFGTRYDFLCANYTAFDQKTFICHFASEVDCKNSPRYFNRNEALYKATTTTTVSPFGSSGLSARRPQEGGRRRRPFRKRKPSYEYDDEYEDLAEDDYYDEGLRRRKRPRPAGGRDSYDEGEEGDEGEKPVSSVLNKSVYERPRVAPKIRRPVPVNEREKYDYSGDSRVIVKESVVEKKKFEDAETGKKQVGGGYESGGSGHSKNTEPDVEREREQKEEDYDREKEREREKTRDRERDERPYRDRRPPKKRRRPDDLDDEYDEYDDVRRHRNRNKPRYEEYEDYEYDERPYRRNRDPEYRVRDHDYDRERNYRNRDSEYDRPRNRDRVRDDDRPFRGRDSDDRPIRIRDDERPLRARDEERPIRNRESDDRLNRKNKNRNRDEDRGYYGDEDDYRDRVKETYRDEPKEEEVERPYKYKDEDDEGDRYRDRNRNQNRPTRYRDSPEKFKGRTPSRNEEESNNGRLRPVDQTERPYRNSERGVARPANGQRTKAPSVSQEDETSSEDISKPVPASRPAYITKPTEATIKQFNDQSGRKAAVAKKPFPARAPSTAEGSLGEQEKDRPNTAFEGIPPQTNRYQERPFERPDYQPEEKQPQLPKYIPPEDIRGTIEQLNDKLLPIQPSGNAQPEFSQPKLRVPHEDTVPKEELAPRAPKFPQTSQRRRPFLPSRNGNAPLPRNLLPVGVKSLQTPRGFQAQNAKPEESEQDAKPETYQFPTNGGVEFRAKVSTAIGVDQPKLTQFFQDVQQSSELELPEYEANPANPSVVNSGFLPQREERPVHEDANPFSSRGRPKNNPNAQELSSSHIIPEYSSGQIQRQENNPVNFRPNLKPADSSQIATEEPSQENRNFEQTFRNRQLPSAINQQFNQQFTTKSPILYPPPPPPPSPPKQAVPQLAQQLGPQGFYSENPKFKTTVKIPEPFPYKPAPPNANFNQGMHLPVFQGGIRPNPKAESQNVRYENGQRQIDPPQENLKPLNLKFPSQNDNLDDSDEFDVSLNDALQPISTLHPRNVPTGVYFSNWQRSPQLANTFKRRVFQGAPPSRQQSDAQEYNTRREEVPPRAGDSRNVPSQQKNTKQSVQRQSSSNVYPRYAHPPVRPVTNHGNYYAVLTQ